MNPRIVAVRIWPENDQGSIAFKCRCYSCMNDINSFDNLSAALRYARSHVLVCVLPITNWTPVQGNEHQTWMLGYK